MLISEKLKSYEINDLNDRPFETEFQIRMFSNLLPLKFCTSTDIWFIVQKKV